MSLLIVSGTGTGIGKTVVTAALAALARAHGDQVAVVKLAQTGTAPGEPGDLEEVRRLSGVTELHELARFPDPLSPEAAARVAGQPPLDLWHARGYIAKLADGGQRVLVEGAGGLLVRYDEAGATIADLAMMLHAPVLMVTAAGLGTLNHTALALEAAAVRGVELAGLVIGSWPARPGLAERCNLTDLCSVAGAPLSGALPEGAAARDRDSFLAAARAGLAPSLGGDFDPAKFSAAALDERTADGP